MKRTPSYSQLFAASVTLLVLAGCSATPGPSQFRSAALPAHSGSISSTVDTSRAALKAPVVIAVDSDTGALEYWPMQQGWNKHPIAISPPGLFNGFGLVANGHVVSFANENPPEVLQYDIDAKTETALADPFGTPLDIAIGKDKSLYVINLVRPHNNNVVMYSGGSPNPQELSCKAIADGTNIAVDNEGNIFVGAYFSRNGTDVVKIPNGPHGPDPAHCTPLYLGLKSAYMAGVVVDPKTDDLVTLTNPDLCAGGVEGLMTVFPKPYRVKTGKSHVVGQNCSSGLRLTADSSAVLVLDSSFAGVSLFVLQRSFPDGRPMATYRNGQPSSVTTIPNTLPN